jgi:hypothetical protein
MRPVHLYLLSALAWASVPSFAYADENLFGYTYGSETLPAGGNEAYVWITHREDKGQGSYNAQDVQFEWEHGWTDRFQTSLYLTGRAHHIVDAAPVEDGEAEYPNVDRNLDFDGVKAAFKWNLLSPYKDKVGLALYLEPGYSTIFKVTGQRMRQFDLEMKLILQKDFLDGQLVTAANLTVEPEWRRFRGDDELQREAEIEVTAAASYRVAPKWFLGVDTRVHTEHPDFGAREHWAVFAGPTLHYGGQKFWFTATWLPQLKGGPIDQERDDRLHLMEHEKNEYRVKIGYNF